MSDLHDTDLLGAAQICSVEECQHPIYRRGFCRKHWNRWLRHGSPTAGGTFQGAPAAFLKAAIEYRNDECLLWPYGKTTNGYGRITYDGHEGYMVHQIVCEAVHGPRPGPKYEIAHNCRTPACVNPRHLRWATHKLIHGTAQRGERNGHSKLTAENVLAIRAELCCHRTQAEVAREFGVSQDTISSIHRGRLWNWL